MLRPGLGAYPRDMPHELVAEYDNASGQGVVEVVSKGRDEVYLTIGGETAYRVGNGLCDTCDYIFEKVYPAQSLREGTGKDDARKLAEILKNLERLPDDETLATIGKVFAPGPYSVMLVRLTPRLAIPGDGSDYFAREAIDTWGVGPLLRGRSFTAHAVLPPRHPGARRRSIRRAETRCGAGRSAVPAHPAADDGP